MQMFQSVIRKTNPLFPLKFRCFPSMITHKEKILAINAFSHNKEYHADAKELPSSGMPPNIIYRN